MNDDATLLRRYAESGSDTAFTALVHRHVDLVYRAALRRTSGDTHRAADVAQQVFTTLARDAHRLAHHTVLPAWLHTATRNAALNLMISDQRRQARELAAHALAPAAADPQLDWDRVRPVLDSAVDDLAEPDRTAVVLRFLEQRTFAEVAAALRVSEDAARVRTGRALEKLRAALARRGITSTAAALGALVTEQPLVSAPAGLAATFALRALATLGTTATATFLTMKFITTVTLSVLVAFGAGAFFGLNRNSPPPAPVENAGQSKLIASLQQENTSLRTQVDQLTARLSAVPPPAKPTPPPPPVAPGKSLGEQQRAMLNNLRQLAAGRDQFLLEYGRLPRAADELVGFTRYIKRYLPVDGEDYRGISMDPKQPMTVTSRNGITVTYDPNGATSTVPDLPPEVVRTEEIAREIRRADARVDELQKKIMGQGMAAEKAYSAANNGNYAPSMEALIPYFATPQHGADWVEFIEAVKVANTARAKK